MGAMGLADAWRILHPTEMQFTFHSGAHISRSRIDYMIVPANQVGQIKEVRHLARGISDHSPVCALVEVGEPQSGNIAPIYPWFLKIQSVKGKSITRN